MCQILLLYKGEYFLISPFNRVVLLYIKEKYCEKPYDITLITRDNPFGSQSSYDVWQSGTGFLEPVGSSVGQMTIDSH